MVVKRIYNGGVALVGFVLSPLSWWNDLVVNFPLSYMFAFPFGLMNQSLFIPMFILGYWLTNVLGFVLMHQGTKKAILREQDVKTKIEFKKLMLMSSAYTVLIVILVYSGFISFPEEFLEKLKGG